MLIWHSFRSNADRRGVGMMGLDAAPSVLAVCRIEGTQSNLYYFNTTFSGGAGVSHVSHSPSHLNSSYLFTVAFLGFLRTNARQI